MNSTKATAHRAGVLYFLFMVVAIVGEFFFPAFMVPGDAAATARNITAAELTYRIGILIGFVTLVIFLFLVVSLSFPGALPSFRAQAGGRRGVDVAPVRRLRVCDAPPLAVQR